MPPVTLLVKEVGRVTREQYELDVLKQHVCPDAHKKSEIKREIIAWAYRRLLADRCVPLRKVA